MVNSGQVLLKQHDVNIFMCYYQVLWLNGVAKGCNEWGFSKVWAECKLEHTTFGKGLTCSSFWQCYVHCVSCTFGMTIANEKDDAWWQSGRQLHSLLWRQIPTKIYIFFQCKQSSINRPALLGCDASKRSNNSTCLEMIYNQLCSSQKTLANENDSESEHIVKRW